MRQERTVQATIFEVFAQHDIGCELKAMSQWLDGQRGLICLVAGDLRRQGGRETGRRGLPAESVRRGALPKQQRRLSYEELAFHLEDSASFRAFARLRLAWTPKKSVLHHTISAIRAETWEAVNRALVGDAKQQRLEDGAMVRIDSTVTAALLHEPSDSALLWDAMRVMSRLLRQAAALPGAAAMRWHDRRRMAKRCATEIQYSRGQDNRRRLYRKLIVAADATRAALLRAVKQLTGRAGDAAARPGGALSAADRPRARPERAPRPACSAGASRREAGQPVRAACRHHRQELAPAKAGGARDVQYGHKLNLVTGNSGLILDLVIEAGNPADAERFLPMLDRHIARCGAPPRQIAADGGYASRGNLDAAKARGVSDVAFHKKRGLAVADMTKSAWVYRKLRNFRAGIEAGISCFKRADGAGCCTWRGLDHFKAYVWSAVVAHNLVLFARLKPA
jgi:IS5 family transposase